jgi:hypothetical protein
MKSLVNSLIQVWPKIAITVNGNAIVAATPHPV